MSILFTGQTNIAFYEGKTVGPGTVVQNNATGDVGAVKWVTHYPSYMYGRSIVPISVTEADRKRGTPPKFEDLVFKVDVWRLGEQRIWYGRDIRIMDEGKGNDDKDDQGSLHPTI